MKPKTFERALHRWKPWLDSIASGRGVLRTQQSPPPLLVMREVAQKTLSELDFPPCTIFELYWLCCVYTDYDTKENFKFDKLILPDWFPVPFGFKGVYHYEFKRKRIFPPNVWNESDRLFWFERDHIVRISSKENREEYFQDFPDKDFILMLSAGHPIHTFVEKGRPITTKSDGETVLE